MLPEDDPFYGEPFPSPAERAQFAELPVLSFPVDVSMLIGIPVSTLEKLAKQGRGPRVFKIGRRRSTTPAFIRAWLDELAEAGAA